MMKVTVCFDAVKVIVPCGEGELTVGDLIERAVARYKKASNKHPADFVQVQVLETIDDQGILDPDDLVRDVLDDRDKLVAVYEEHKGNRPTQNGRDSISTSSAGTASPDIFQETQNERNRTPPNTVKDVNQNHSTLPKLITGNSPVKLKGPPPPVAPKPKMNKKPEPSVSESVPSEEDSGISIDVRTRMESDSLNSEYGVEPVSTPRKYSETAFVAIGTPVQNKHFEFNGNKEPRKESSSDFEHTDDDLDHDGFALERDMTRQSMFVDNPVMDRWAELQDNRQRDLYKPSNRMPPVATVSPVEEQSFSYSGYQVQHMGADDSSSSGDDSDDIFVIELRPEDDDDLGFNVQGYKTADGRELGLIVREITPGKCASRDGRLQIADRIVEVNDHNLLDLPNDKAEQIFQSAVQAPVVKLAISGCSSFVPGHTSKPSKPSELPIVKAVFNESAVTELTPRSPGAKSPLEPPPDFRDSNSPISAPQISLNSKTISKRMVIELIKGSDGLGFSITTRDNPAGGHTPIFVKSILAKGAAIQDGRLQNGDQIIEVNGAKMLGKNQGEAVNVLRSTQGLVKLLIQREEVIRAPTKPAIELNEESTRYLREQGKQVLTFKIPLNMSGAAGLGVSVKGKVDDPEDGRDSPRDKGIYVKSVIAGGAAFKDCRLKPDDQLLSVNNMSFMGLTNTEAIDNLRQAMQSTRLGQAFIETTVARNRDPMNVPGTLYDSRSLEALNAPQQERSIEGGDHQSPIDIRPHIYVNGPATTEHRQEDQVDAKVQHADYEEDEELDSFNDSSVSINPTPIKSRNAVQRNESYCFAVNRTPGTYSPFQAKPARRSPLSLEEQPSMASTPTGAYPSARNMSPGPLRPTSTVAVPTPPLESTGGSPGRSPLPVPPPRMDSFRHNTSANYRIYQYYKERGSPNAPRTPQPPIDNVPSSSSEDFLPSYEETMERLRVSPAVSEHAHSRSSRPSEESDDVVFAGSDLPDDNPFDREGFGRQSMSEKRGRSALDAKKTETFQKHKGKVPLERRTSEPGDEDEHLGKPSPLRKAKSEGQMRSLQGGGHLDRPAFQARLDDRAMLKSNSESVLRDAEHGGVPIPSRRRNSASNPSFRSAMEGSAPPNGQVREMSNGNPRVSQSDEPQDEIPITMTSQADFMKVQEKLANKKPFYRKFKLGKARRGDYNLSDSEGSPKHTLYTQEALIDFPAEQRYRQLVSHYGKDDWDDRSSRQSTDNESTHSSASSNIKVGRVIVSEPTRV